MASITLENPAVVRREMASISAREMLLWTLVAVLVFAGLALHFRAIDCNDGYQYISIAENISNNGRIATSLVHFDTERAHAQLPAPVTWFPPGYPAAIFLVSKVGIAREVAAETISILAVALVTLLLARLCSAIGCGANATRLAVFFWISSSYAVEYSRTISSEALFTATVTAAVLLLVASDQSVQERGAAPITLVWAFVLVGLSACVRYAGYFIFCAFLVYALLLLSTRVRRKIVVLASLAAGGGIIAGLLLRNFLVSSTWQGSNNTPFSTPVLETARAGVGGFIKLIFGDVARTSILLPAIGGCAILLLGVVTVRARGPLRFGRSLYVVAGVLCVYCALMFYAGLRTPISFGARMFFPVLPLILAILSRFIAQALRTARSGPQHRAVVTCIAAFAICYVVTNARSDFLPPLSSPAAAARRQLARPDDHGRPLWEWIDGHTGPQTVLVAAEGQAAGYVLHRPTVSLVEHRFSQVNWTETQVRQTMAVFRARYLLVFPGANRDDAPSEYESSFLLSLLHRQSPAWLQIAESSPEVIVYEKIR